MRDFLTKPLMMSEVAAARMARSAAALLSVKIEEVRGSVREPAERARYAKVGLVGVVQVKGVLYNGYDEFADYFGWSSYQDLAMAVDAAAADPAVNTIVLEVDSPGGMVEGVTELYGAVARARNTKRLVAVARHEMCSAAYHACCPAHEIFVTPTSTTGNVGCFCVLYDWSKAYEAEGVKVQVVRRGANKGMGTPGTPITEAQLTVLQAWIDESYEGFAGAVSQWRGIPRAVVDAQEGAFYGAQAAVREKIADGVLEFADVIANEGSIQFALNRAAAGTAAASRAAEATTTEDPMDLKSLTIDQLSASCPELVAQLKAQGAAETAEKPATVDELEKQFPGEDRFVLAQLKAKATLSQAKGAFADELKARLDASEKAHTESEKAKATKPAVHRGREEPVAHSEASATGGEDGPKTYEQAVDLITADLMKQDSLPRKRARNVALMRAAREFPKLHAKWQAGGAGVRDKAGKTADDSTED